jgi:hypothetical protein
MKNCTFYPMGFFLKNWQNIEFYKALFAFLSLPLMLLFYKIYPYSLDFFKLKKHNQNKHFYNMAFFCLLPQNIIMQILS